MAIRYHTSVSELALSARFSAIAARYPQRLALVDPMRRRTYAELADDVERVAGAIERAAGGAHGPVAAVLPHGALLATGVLAGLQSGRAVVPIDPSMPAARSERIFADAGVVAVLHTTATDELAVAGRAGRTAALEHPHVLAPDAVALLLYTSGSTGAPKGVVYSHARIAARIVDDDRFALGPDDRIGVFGGAGMNLFRALLRGAALVSWDLGRDGLAGVGAWIAREELTLLHVIPTVARRLAPAVAAVFPRLRHVNLTGEPLYARDVAILRACFPPPCVLLNGLGTTEAGTFCQGVIDDSDDPTAPVPVGRAVAGVELQLLDPSGQPVAAGDSGEIVVGGALLAAGYWNQPALERARFVDDPAHPGMRRYHTGDLGRWRPDGALVHLGRSDAQLKIRGVRIEPAEVEGVLRAHPAVRDVAVIGHDEAPGERRLIACIASSAPRPTPATLARWVRDRLSAAMVPDGWTFVESLPALPSGKVDRRAVPLPPPRRAPPEPGIAARFAAQEARAGEALAYRGRGGSLSFAELERRVARLASRLRAAGVDRDGVVALALPREPQYAVSLLAVLRAGGACMPLDPRGPQLRNEAMLRESGARWLLIPPDVPFEVPPGVNRIDPEASHACDETVVPSAYDPQRLAFVLYTSGSTGKPKGVELSEGQVLHRLRFDWECRPFAAGEVTCQRGATGFVDALAEWLGGVLQGVPTEVVPDEVLRRPRALVDTLARAAVSRILLVPSQLDLLLDAAPDLGMRLPALRLWTASGEPLSRGTVARFRAACPNATLWNVYGATEAWDATAHRLTGDEAAIPIGRALPGMRTYLLDAALAPVPTGVAGDLYLAGAGVARGYRGEPQLTAERFVPNPFTPHLDDRLYRTGDRARCADDGTLEHLGRADRQVQLHGVRVELGEVEAALARCDGVREAAALMEGTRLIACVAADAGVTLERPALRAQLRTRLLAAALPHEIAVLTALPRDARGKVDRAACADPARRATLLVPSIPTAPGTQPVVPTDLEEAIIQVFVDLLDRAVTVDDDFFDLGGDSLLAVQLVAELEALTARTLPLDALVVVPTPRGIAAVLSAEGFPWTDAQCLTLHPEASGPPLFGLCGAWGFAVRLLRLGRKLGDDIPLYALQPPGMEWPRDIDLAAIGAHYAREMRRLQPRGPYRVFGTSFGGVIGFATALALEAQGCEVALLAMVDSAVPGSPLQPRLPLDPAHAHPLDLIGERVYMAHLRAAATYRPTTRVAAPILYFRCAESTHAHHVTWQRHAQRPLEIVVVPGGHGAFHIEPQLSSLAAALGPRLRAPTPPRPVPPRSRWRDWLRRRSPASGPPDVE